MSPRPGHLFNSTFDSPGGPLSLARREDGAGLEDTKRRLPADVGFDGAKKARDERGSKRRLVRRRPRAEPPRPRVQSQARCRGRSILTWRSWGRLRTRGRISRLFIRGMLSTPSKRWQICIRS